MKPKISVIIPVHNSERTIGNILISLSKQSFSGFEIIVVDDCSDDNTPNIIKKFNVIVVKNKRNLGPAKSRNIGIRRAKSNIIAFIDSDCYATENWLTSILKNLKNKKADVLMGNTKIPKSTFLGNSISALGFPGGANAGFRNMWHVDKQGFTNHITSCNFAARKRIFDMHGGFDESFPLPGGEDPELSYRLVKKGVKIKYCNDVVIYHIPRKDIASFIKWNILRGRTNYHFKKKIGKVSGFIKLRLWSSKNILLKNLFDFKIILIIPLLFLSFALQQYGYFLESFRSKSK